MKFKTGDFVIYDNGSICIGLIERMLLHHLNDKNESLWFELRRHDVTGTHTLTDFQLITPTSVVDFIGSNQVTSLIRVENTAQGLVINEIATSYLSIKCTYLLRRCTK